MTDIFDIVGFLQANQISFEKYVDLKTKTWIKRGGIAKLWIQPVKLSNFEILISWCQLNKIHIEVIGNTSNCYFLNNYNPDVVISTLNLNEIQVDEETITCDCGYNMSRLTKYCISQGIAGFEGFIGLPGTVGGAAINNAGCYGSLISDVVKEISIIKDGEKCLLTNKQLNYSHRNSALKSKEIDGIVTSVTFKIKNKEDKDVLDKRAKAFQLQRMTFQEHSYPNLGSTFAVLEFKTLPIIIRIVNAISQRLINFMIKNQVIKQKLKTKLYLRLHGAGSFRKYVSEYNIGCYTWKDEFADHAFNEYLNFIKLNSNNFKMEIDIKERYKAIPK